MSAPHDAVISIPPYDPYRLATVLRELTGDKLNVWSQRLSRTKAWSRLRVEEQGMRLANNMRVPWSDGMNVAECVERLSRLGLWPWDAGDGIARFTVASTNTLSAVPPTHEAVVCFASIPQNVVREVEELATRAATALRRDDAALQHDVAWWVFSRMVRYSRRFHCPKIELNDALNARGFGNAEERGGILTIVAPRLHDAHNIMPDAGDDGHCPWRVARNPTAA